MNPLEHRVKRFQELVDKGKYYRIMNWNLALLRQCFRKGKGKFVKPEPWEILNHYENFGFF